MSFQAILRRLLSLCTGMARAWWQSPFLGAYVAKLTPILTSPLHSLTFTWVARPGIYIFNLWLRAFWVLWWERTSSLWNNRLANRCFWKPLLPNLLQCRKKNQVRKAATVLWQMATFCLLGLGESLWPFSLRTPKSCQQAVQELISRALSTSDGWNQGINTKHLYVTALHSCWEVIREFKRQNQDSFSRPC